MKTHLPKSRQEFVLRALVNKYHADPSGFRGYLPEVAQELEQLEHARAPENRSVLTELERERVTRDVVQLLHEKDLSVTKAVQALEYCATLIQDKSLPLEVDRKVMLELIHRATGTPLSDIKMATRIEVSQADTTKEIAVLRGVHFHLTWNDRLVAILVSPTKAKERSQALKFVGIAKDSSSNVAQRHDVYLAEAVSDAVS